MSGLLSCHNVFSANLSSAKISSKNKKNSIKMREVIIKLWKERKTLKEIGGILNKTQSSVQRVVQNCKATKSKI